MCAKKKINTGVDQHMRLSNSIVVLVIVLGGCATKVSAPVQEFVIANFKQGLMRDNGAQWEVFESGTNFNYRHNGECVANGVRRSCMWHGYTFDYDAPKARTELSCVRTLNRPQHLVNPRQQLGVSSGSEFKLELPNKRGFFYAPGYQTPKNELPGVVAQKIVCSYGGKVVFENSFAVTFSESDIAAERP
jgi:hypothetical protein